MKKEKLPVKIGVDLLPKPMTAAQALLYAIRNMPSDLKNAGFVASVFASNSELHGGSFFRINYSK
jgi:hypothetical protein